MKETIFKDLSINADSTYDCTGCSVCKVVCPVEDCISLPLNKDGFIEALSNADTCIQCGKCQKVCYKFHDVDPFNFNTHQETYVSTNKDKDIQYKSSSGGIVTALCKVALADGYTILGATFDIENNRVKHIQVNKEEDLYKIRGSKYFNSICYEEFSQIKKHKKYLVIGTPCQIGGLKKFFDRKKGYEQVITVDFRCFGVAGYNLLDKYVDHIQENITTSKIKKLNMRSKAINWQRWGVEIDFEDGSKYYKDKFDDLFAMSFRSGQAVHEVCQTCTIYQNGIPSDIRVEDAWAFVNEQTGSNLKNGTSQVGIFSDKGRLLFEKVKELLILQEVEYDYSVPRNRQLSDNKLFLSKLSDDMTPLQNIVDEYLQNHPKEKRTFVWQYLNTLWYYKHFVRYWPKKPKDIFISIAVFFKMDLKWILKKRFTK
ncbi:Coenzyme F420 hydrogenase/dehydrogenase, beta subunit C-terminal domain [Halarcobacter sp.]|uniref:Coenzyme F420 hydrogenase/dehydrogenase, beta subunit C-terminal domain n=1 Tax=Halarcobacter sp. TaxID=2321133 RepID=UPI003A8FB42B